MYLLLELKQLWRYRHGRGEQQQRDLLEQP